MLMEELLVYITVPPTQVAAVSLVEMAGPMVARVWADQVMLVAEAEVLLG